MRLSRRSAWGMVAAGLVIYLVPDLLGALLVGLGAAALFVSEETYRKRKRQAMGLLEEVGLRPAARRRRSGVAERQCELLEPHQRWVETIGAVRRFPFAV